MINYNFRTLTKIAIITTLIWHLVSYLIDDIFEDNDDANLLLNNNFDYILNKNLIRFDSFFFVSNALNGYIYEKNHAFLPGYVNLIKIMNRIFSKYCICSLIIC